jgi:hypothetical protein
VAAGRLVTVAEAVAPRRFERVTRRYIDGRQFAAEPAPATDGNLYAPVSDGRAEARGGWRRRPDPPPRLRRLAAVGLLAAWLSFLVMELDGHELLIIQRPAWWDGLLRCCRRSALDRVTGRSYPQTGEQPPRRCAERV